jgi:hypothetical protein
VREDRKTERERKKPRDRELSKGKNEWKYVHEKYPKAIN